MTHIIVETSPADIIHDDLEGYLVENYISMRKDLNFQHICDTVRRQGWYKQINDMTGETFSVEAIGE